jgi:hypothetical protein
MFTMINPAPSALEVRHHRIASRASRQPVAPSVAASVEGSATYSSEHQQERSREERAC